MAPAASDSEAQNNDEIGLRSGPDRQSAVGKSEAQELLYLVKDTISRLFRLSMLIRDANRTDRFTRALTHGKAIFDSDFDVNHVGQKFPRLMFKDKEWLKERLGRAITNRRNFLHYAREHQVKLSGQDGGEIYPSKSAPKSAPTVPDTKASTIALPVVPKANSDQGDVASETSYVTSVCHPTDGSPIRLPHLRDISGGSALFVCPLCRTIQEIVSEKSWE